MTIQENVVARLILQEMAADDGLVGLEKQQSGVPELSGTSGHQILMPGLRSGSDTSFPSENSNGMVQFWAKEIILPLKIYRLCHKVIITMGFAMFSLFVYVCPHLNMAILCLKYRYLYL